MVMGGFVVVLMLDRWEALDTGSEVAFTGVFQMVASIGSVGVDADEGVLGGSPTATKFC